MSVTQVAERITSKPKAIMAVHIYGHPVDMAPIQSLAMRHHLHVMRDAPRRMAQSIAVCVRKPRTHRVFSFYAISCNHWRSGKVVTNDDELAERFGATEISAFVLTDGSITRNSV